MARPGFTAHRKFGRIVHMLGMPEPHVLGHLEYLWASSYENGEPVIGDSVDVELAAKWTGEKGEFTKALLECGGESRAGLIEPVEGRDDIYQIHDLFDHAPDYVRKRAEREAQRRETGKSISDIRRAAAKSRWMKAPSKLPDANGNQLHGFAFLHGAKSAQNLGSVPENAENCGAAKLRGTETSVKKHPDFRTKDANECRLHANGSTPAPAPINTKDGKAALFSTEAVEIDQTNIVLTFPTVKGKRSGASEWHLRQSLAKELAALFPDLNVVAVARAALAWVIATPSKRKTAGGMRKFLTLWMTREQNSGRGRRGAVPDDDWKGMSESEADEIYRRAGITGGEA